MTAPAVSVPLVRIKDLHKSFGAVEVLKGVSLTVNKGEAVCIIGPSGSGKSTLLRCINGLIPVDRGEVHVGTHAVHLLRTDREMIALRKDVSIVFQQYNLFPHKTALENIMMAPVDVLGQPRAEVEARAHDLLKKVRLAGKEGSYPGELSGGQQQRVAIARALAMRPSVMLFDEVTAALDPETRKEVLVDDPPAGRGRHDVDPGHARDGLRPRDRQSRVLHRPRRDRRGRHAGGAVRQSAHGAHARVPGAGAVASGQVRTPTFNPSTRLKPASPVRNK